MIACLIGAITSNAVAAHIPGTVALGGWVYIDRNNDGHLAFSNEPNPEYAISDVWVQLYSKSGSTETQVDAKQTDQYGRYYFDNLTPGTYVLRQTQPVEYVDGIDTLGQLLSLDGQPIPPPPSTSRGTMINNAFLDIKLTANVAGDYYNFGERGLAAGYASKRDLFYPPPPSIPVPEPASALLVLAGVCCTMSRPSRRR